MAVKLRLRRLGRKGKPYYHVVASDSRSPRDGKFIEQVGVYDPTRNPAQVEINHDKAIQWLKNGAQPTDTVRAILKYTGVNMKYALIKQGKDEGTVETLYNKWWEERQSKVSNKVSGLDEAKRKAAGERKKLESSIREVKTAQIRAKNTPPAPVVEEVAPPTNEVAPPTNEVAPAAEEAPSTDNA